MESYGDALTFFSRYTGQNKECLQNSLVNLTYALSYHYFNQHYFQNPESGVITLAILLKEHPKTLLVDCIDYMKKVKRDERLLFSQKVKEFLRGFQQLKKEM